MNLARPVDLRPEDLAGKRWAGYVRDSTAVQADRYGPDLQRAEQRRYAERYGLIPTGREYIDLVSGKDTLRRSDFNRMLADAGAGEFDVVLCYDTSRFARNVADAWTYRDKLAAAGVVIVFCADGLISGNTDTYELEGLKTVSDAAYIRRLSRNVSKGYEQKWRLWSDPGGHPPLGFARVGERQLLEPVEGPDLELVRRAFDLYAAGSWSDAALADELGIAEAGLAEILTNPLYAGRAIRHKGRPDEEERPARFASPVDPALFERVQAIRARRRTRHPGVVVRRSYPLVRLMVCARCGSPYHGDANNGYRRVRHVRRPSCSPSATYRADLYERQLADRLDGISFSEADMRQIQAAMRSTAPAETRPDPGALQAARDELHRKLDTGEISIGAFSREWRALERPAPVVAVAPSRDRLERARELLSGFGTLWRDPEVPHRLREEAVSEMFTRLDVDGPDLVAAYPAPNENAWLLGQAGLRDRSLQMQEHMGLVGARGVAPTSQAFRF